MVTTERYRPRAAALMAALACLFFSCDGLSAFFSPQNHANALVSSLDPRVEASAWLPDEDGLGIGAAGEGDSWLCYFVTDTAVVVYSPRLVETARYKPTTALSLAEGVGTGSTPAHYEIGASLGGATSIYAPATGHALYAFASGALLSLVHDTGGAAYSFLYEGDAPGESPYLVAFSGATASVTKDGTGYATMAPGSGLAAALCEGGSFRLLALDSSSDNGDGTETRAFTVYEYAAADVIVAGTPTAVSQASFTLDDLPSGLSALWFAVSDDGATLILAFGVSPRYPGFLARVSLATGAELSSLARSAANGLGFAASGDAVAAVQGLGDSDPACTLYRMGWTP